MNPLEWNRVLKKHVQTFTQVLVFSRLIWTEVPQDFKNLQIERAIGQLAVKAYREYSGDHYLYQVPGYKIVILSDGTTIEIRIELQVYRID